MVKTSHCETLLVCTHTYSRGDFHNQFSVMSLLSLSPSYDKPFVSTAPVNQPLAFAADRTRKNLIFHFLEIN